MCMKIGGIKVDLLALFLANLQVTGQCCMGGLEKHAGPFTSELLVAETRLDL